MSNKTPPVSLPVLFKEATEVTDAALDVFDHIKAPVFSSSVIAKDLLADESIPEHARAKILAILDNMELAKFLLEHFTFKLDVACEGWKDALKKAAGDSHA